MAASASVAPGHAAGPRQVDLASDAGAAAATWPLRAVAETGEAALVGDADGRFGPLPGGPWPEPPTDAIVLPLVAPGQARPTGFLVAGVNTRRRLDSQYRSFLDLAAGHVAMAVANARAYEEERRRAEALAELDRAKTAFFSNVSHEFRTPLTLLMSPLEELLARPAAEIPPADHALLEVAHRNSLRLLRLVNGLLDFSRVEAGRARASFEPVDLAAYTADLASNFRSACERAGLALAVDCPPLPWPVHVDREMWEKIVLNLLSNAFKFTFEGGIEVRLTATSAGAELRVSDTGVGIPEDEQPHLFERFHRVEGQRSRSHEGSGIGLALVHDLVELHGGAIRVRSEVGRGTEFVVAVPSGTAHLPAGHVGGARRAPDPAPVRADAYVEEALRWLPGASAPPESEPAATGVRERVLLVDDNADMRDHVRRLLGRRYEVEAVADGTAALASLRARLPDLVLSDVMMPGLDGVGLLHAIRADPGLRELPVILLSARAGDEAKAEGLDAGADDYLAKPFSARELLARVGANVAMARVRRGAADALRESEARFRTMADNAPALIYVVDAQGQVTFANRHYEALFGRPVDDILGDGWRRIVHPEDVERFHAAFLAAFAERRPFRAEVRVADAAGALRWLRCEAVPRLGPSGEFQGYVGCNVDVTEAKVAEATLREREAELARVQRIGGVGGLEVDLRDGFRNRRSPEYLRLHGLPPEAAREPHEDWVRRIHPEDRERAEARFRACVVGGAREYGAEYRIVRPSDGQVRWIAARAEIERDAQGRALRLVGAHIDVTALKEAEAALRASEERYRLIIESATDYAIFALDLDGHVTSWNTGAERILGYAEADVLGRPGDLLFTPEDREAGAPDAELRAALEEERAEDERWHLRKDGSRFWASGLMMPLKDDAGAVRGFLKILRDRTDKRREEEHRKLLLDELNHRVKNTLATVQSVAMQTIRTSETPAAFHETFVARLMALSRGHDLLTRGEWRGASLAEVVRQTLAPYTDGADDDAAAAGRRLSVGGPPVRLSPNAAVTLNMTFHELATNAAKYGALSAPGGRVEVAWSLDRPPAGEESSPGAVELIWRERGGPPVEPPRRRGFGTRLIERGARHELAAEVRLEFAPGGVEYRARLPLSAMVWAS